MYEFSHQAGHVEAAIYGSGAEQLHGKRFYAFHVSGGTTELLEVSEDGTIECIGGSADINAGQLIDRVGVMLGMHFPCGPELEALALRGIASGVSLPERPRVCVRGLECNLSGFENKARHMLDRGEGAESVAMYTLEAVALSLAGLRDGLIAMHGKAPVLFSGGVMSCSLIKPRLAGDGMLFAPPRFSADNAAGIALLCRARHIGGKKHLRDN
jgi:metal-dependent proteases with possible chaperone activity